MLTLTQKLERIKNYSTRYELTMRNGSTSYLIAYTAKRSRHGILSAVRGRGEIIAKIAGERITFAKRAADGATIGDWRINFSGRTQRDCYMLGELPYIGDIAI